MKKIWIYFIIFISVVLILAGIFRVLTASANYQVIAISDNTKGKLGVTDSVELIFNKTISSGFAENCQISFSPKLDFLTKTQEDKLEIKAKTRFIPDQEYNLIVICKNQEILNLPLKIKTDEELTPEEIRINQTHLDYEVGQEFLRVLEEKPWRANLPISNDKYIIAYDQDDDVIMVVLRPGVRRDFVENEVKTAIQKAEVPIAVRMVWK